MKRIALIALALALAPACKSSPANGTSSSAVVITTSLGTIKAELFPDKAPVTVKNFLSYVDSRFYDGTVFHRVIRTFMIQGGGYDQSMAEKPTGEPIVNEGGNGLKNERGTLAMARTNNPDSATAQFFINVVDNEFLNRSQRSPGYAVFGRVTDGMDVVDRIKSVPTGTSHGMSDVPETPVVIQSIRRAR